MSGRRIIWTCCCCNREMRTGDARRGFRHGMCRECRTDTDISDCGIDMNEDLRSAAEDHDAAYNGGEIELDYDDVSFD